MTLQQAPHCFKHGIQMRWKSPRSRPEVEVAICVECMRENIERAKAMAEKTSSETKHRDAVWNDFVAAASVSMGRTLETMAWRPVELQIRKEDRFLLVATILFAMFFPWVVAPWVYQQFAPISPPDVRVESPVTVDGVTLAEAMSVSDFERDPETGLILRPPEPAEDADLFRSACNDVCVGMDAYGDDHPPARMLVADPEHQVCTCFTGTAVVRFVEWQRR